MVMSDFKVNEDVGVVYRWKMADTSIEGDMNRTSAPERIKNLMRFIDWYDNYDCEYNLMKAKARCNDGDTFDEKIGRSIVDSKLEYKRHMRMARKYDKIYRLLCQTLPYVEERVATHMKKAGAIYKDLNNHYWGGGHD